MDKPLWEPSEQRVKDANVTRFMAYVNEKHGAGANGYDALHAFSINRQEEFWTSIWDFCGVKASVRGERVIADATKMPGAKYFPDARFNYAENLLRRRDDTPAMIFRGEDKARSIFSWGQLYDLVSRIEQGLGEAGLAVGDRVAAIVPNMPRPAPA